jgi:hypothetical protein
MPDALLAEFNPVEAGRELMARSEHGAAAVVIEAARPDRSWPFGTTLDGALTLDLDDEHVLVHADLMWMRSEWKRGTVSLPEPAHDVRALRLPNLSTDALADQLVRVTPILGGKTLAIWIGEQESDKRVPLGPSVYALTRGAMLAGIVIEGL